jgi:2-polyprenyl-3-methyl-5-hydroxy-6-metoxy-1,4-benzoquinol methylase
MIDLALEGADQKGPSWWDAKHASAEADGLSHFRECDFCGKHFHGRKDTGCGRRLLELFQKDVPRDCKEVMMAGSGSGVLMNGLAKRRPELVWSLADWSEEALNAAAARDAPLVGTYRHNLNVFPWPFGDAEYDGVFLAEILEYLDDPQAALDEAARVGRRFLAATFPIHRDLITSAQHWLFEPTDPWRMMPGRVRIHHLKESRLLLAFSTL